MSKRAVTIALLYTIFATLSTAINISTQFISIQLYKGIYSIELSILMGTLAGLPLRYILEKRHIFNFESRNFAHDGRLFVLYSFMGAFTTIIFWLIEYTFQLIFATDHMRYIGGIFGLTIGFYVKYQLDKKYVFVNYDNNVAS